MNKKLITLAVAAALAAPAAAMAEATLYGVLHQSIDYIDQDDWDRVDLNGNPVIDPNTGEQETVKGFEGWSVNRSDGTILRGNGPVGPSNRVGVKGSEDLGNGLKAVYQVEFGVTLSDRDRDIDNGDRGDGVNMRNSFVGLAGDWGTFLVGRHDTPLKISTGKLDLFADTMADYNGPLGFDDVRADNTVTYISPSWSGFQLAGAVIPGGRATVAGTDNIYSDSIAEGYSVAAIYSNGPWYASAAYEGMETDLGAVSGDLFDDYNKWRLGLGILDWNGFSLTGIYEGRENTAFLSDWDSDSWEVQAGYAFGNSMIKANYGQNQRDSDEEDGDLDSWSVGFDHNFSKRTKVYALYTNVNDSLDVPNFVDWQGFSMGVVCS
jgi:predicted porin